ncbi:YdcF family protein [Hydrocoleum sp. CS-953]|uniref:YdcF family protein n=1 Tax=Hydrocoleum sp. CS-953 TaxID=1671698 RepID=UPI00117BD8D1
MSYQQFAGSIEPPQALLVLGGAIEREVFAAEFAQQHPHLDIWVSSGTNPEYAEWLFSQAGISQTRLHLDYDAVDTVTNFTTIVDKLKSQGITSVYLVTSDDHMRRATVIGQIILGSRGISFKPLPVPSGRSPEPIEKVIRDGIRGIVWLTTGYTGANLLHQFSP